MLVEDGKKAIAQLIANEFKYMRLGDGGDDTSPRQSALDHAVTGESLVTITVVNNQIIFNCQFTGTEIQATNISELGIFSQDDYPAAEGKGVIDNKLLARVNFNSLGPFASSDTVNLTLVMEVE